MLGFRKVVRLDWIVSQSKGEYFQKCVILLLEEILLTTLRCRKPVNGRINMEQNDFFILPPSRTL